MFSFFLTNTLFSTKENIMSREKKKKPRAVEKPSNTQTQNKPLSTEEMKKVSGGGGLNPAKGQQPQKKK